MKITLLDAVQQTLSSIDGDEIDTISDTVQARQVADIAKSVFYEIVTNGDLNEHRRLYTLDPSNDINKPTMMLLPEHAMTLEWVKYNNQDTPDTLPTFKQVQYMALNEFLDYIYGFNPAQDNVSYYNHIVGTDTLVFYYQNDVFPQFYTTYDDRTLLFDSYNSSFDTTLQKSKTQCFGRIEPTWVMEDSFVPDMDTSQFTLWLNEMKAQASIEQRQVANMNAERKARRNWITTQSSKTAIAGLPELYKLPDYGRK